MKENDIIEIANKNNGYLYSKIIKEYNIESVYITRLLKKQKLIKVFSGIYVTPTTIIDNLFVNAIRFSRIVYSGDTALFLNGLSNKQYPEYEVSIPYGTHVPKIEGFDIKQTRNKNFDIGIVNVETPFGNNVRCYNRERCVCDLFLRPDNYDYEERIFAINEYKNNYLNLDNLYKCAKELGVLKEVENVFEVIAWN